MELDRDLEGIAAFIEAWSDQGSLPTMPPPVLMAYTDAFRDMFEKIQDFPAYPDLDSADRERCVGSFKELRVFLHANGDLTGLKDLMEELVEWSSGTENPMGQAWFLNILSIVCRQLTLHEAAERHIRHAIDRVEAFDPNHPTLAVLLGNRGINHLFTREWDASRKYIDQAEAHIRPFAEDCLQPFFKASKTTLVASFWNNKASTYLSPLYHNAFSNSFTQHYIDESEKLILNARKNYTGPLNLALAQCNLTMIRVLQGNFEEASAMIFDLEHRLDKDSGLFLLRSTVERLRGEFARHQGRADDAVEHFRHALEISLKSPNPEEEEFTVTCFMQMVRLEASLAQASSQKDDSSTNRLDRLRSLSEKVIPLLESKDWYTGHNHAQAVGNLAVQLIKALEAKNPELVAQEKIDYDKLYMAGLLHDIGKLAVPWAILNKIRPLKPDEREVLKRHPGRGGEMLTESGFAELGAVIAEHHERPDGQGYPSGKNTLSLMGAAVALADAYEASITPNRRWRHPKTPREACDELIHFAGSQVDVRLAGILRGVVKQKN